MREVANARRPVVVFSTPRSGSTLLSCLLDATGYIGMLNEPAFYPRPTGVAPPRVLKTWTQRSLYLQSLWSAPPRVTYPEAARALCEIATQSPSRPLPIAGLWRWYGERVADLRGRQAWGHKQPDGPGWWRQELVLMPEAHAVILLREPVSVAASFFGRGWGVLWRGGPYPPEVRAAAAALAIRGLVQPLAEAIYELPSNRRTVVRYEDLATSPEATLESLSPVLGNQDWSAAVRDFTETPIARHASRNKELHDSLRRPIDPSVARRWRDGLAPDHLRILQVVLAEAGQRLGYPSSGSANALTKTEVAAVRRAERTLAWLRTTRRTREQVGGRAKWLLSAMPPSVSRAILAERSPTMREWRERAASI